MRTLSLYAIALLLYTSLAAIPMPLTTPASSTASSLPSPTNALEPVFLTTKTQAATEPGITAPPSIEDISIGLQQKWHVETYYSCHTRGTSTHCGWHRPVRPGGTEIAGAMSLDGRKGAMAAGCLVVGALFL